MSGMTTVVTRMPSGQYMMKQSNLVNPQSREIPKQRPALSPGTISVVQPAAALVPVQSATVMNPVVSGSIGRSADQIQLRKFHISYPTALSSHMKVGTLATGLQPVVQHLAVTTSSPPVPLKVVSCSVSSAFSSVVSAPKSSASFTEGTISTNSAAVAQPKKVVMSLANWKLKSQPPTITPPTMTLVPTTTPVILCTGTVPISQSVVQTQQLVSKSVQKGPVTTLTHKQPQVIIHGQKPPPSSVPSTIRLESSGATSSVRAALNAASTQQGRDPKTVSGATTQPVKPTGTNLPPPPALIHTPKENTQKVSKKDTISPSTRWVSPLSSSSSSQSVQPATSTPVCKADSNRPPNVLLYKSVGSKKLGNLNSVNMTVQSPKSSPGQRKRPDAKRSPLQNDSGLKRIKIVTGKAIHSKQTDPKRAESKQSNSKQSTSTLTAEDLALMARFSQWGDSGSSDSENNRGESQQSIRDDPDFRPTSSLVRRFKRPQRGLADGDSEDDHSKRRKNDMSDEGSDDFEVHSSRDNQRNQPQHCKHCGSTRYFSRADSIYCGTCKKKLRHKVTNTLIHSVRYI
jgi:hypothetical protein